MCSYNRKDSKFLLCVFKHDFKNIKSRVIKESSIPQNRQVFFSTYMLCDNYATENNIGSMKHTNRYSNQTLNQHFYLMVSCKFSKLSQVEPLFWKFLTVKS